MVLTTVKGVRKIIVNFPIQSFVKLFQAKEQNGLNNT